MTSTNRLRVSSARLHVGESVKAFILAAEGGAQYATFYAPYVFGKNRGSIALYFLRAARAWKMPLELLQNGQAIKLIPSILRFEMPK